MLGIVLEAAWAIMPRKSSSKSCPDRPNSSHELIIKLVLWPNVFPLWVIWFGSSFLLLGGGANILIAMLWTMLADAIPIAQRYGCQLFNAQGPSNVITRD
jgi:hypothetical protein